jgi:hypothetical protein
VLLVLLVLTATSCSDGSDGKTHRFMLGTAGTGGEVYMWGGGASRIVGQYAPNVALTAQLTAGSGENLIRLRNGTLQVALASNELNWEMSRGNGDLPKYDHRALFAMYIGEWHWGARRDFPGNTIYDFKGKKVSFGPKGGGSYELVKYVLDALGLSFADFDAQYLSVAESVDAFKDGSIDGYVVALGTPSAAFLDLATTRGGIKLISLSPEDIQKARAKYDFLSETVIPPSTYNGVDYEVRGVGRWHFMVARPDFPEEAAYQIVKALTEHHNELVRIVAAARQSTAENSVSHTVLPLHSGAERYFREKQYLH